MKMTEPYSPTPRAKASAKPVRMAARQQNAGDGLETVRAERCRHLLHLPVDLLHHRLHGADDEGQTDEDQRDDDTGRRERNLDAIGLKQRTDPAAIGVKRRQRNARDRRWKRKGKVHDGIHEAATGKAVTCENPGDDDAEDHIDQCGEECRAKTDAQRIQRTAIRGNRNEICKTEFRRGPDKAAKRNKNDEKQIGDGVTKRQAEARYDARLPPPPPASGNIIAHQGSG